MKNLKMKHKILIVIFLPVLVLSGFLYSFFRHDYLEIQKEKGVQEASVFLAKMMNLSEALIETETLSQIQKKFPDSPLVKELPQQKRKIDEAKRDLEVFVSQMSYFKEEGAFKDNLQRFMSHISTMDQNQMRSEGNALDKNYETIQTDLNESSAFLSTAFSNYRNTEILHELLSLDELRIGALKIKGIITEALYADKISPEQFVSLQRIIGEVRGSRSDFFNLSPKEDQQLLKDALETEDLIAAEQTIQNFSSKGTLGRFGINPLTWWKQQSLRSVRLKEVTNQVLQNNEKKLLVSLSESNSNFWFVLISALIALLVSIGIVFLSLRFLSKTLQEDVILLSSSGESILRSITETSSAMSETAAAVTETTATVEELRQTAQVSAEKAKNVADVSEEALTTLKTCEESIEDTISGMKHIQEGMNTISESIIKLSDHSKAIGEIIDTVNDLAEQSHLLAVNAAIEAAKAGDQGKGFTVVAQEVRSLANQSKQATIQVRNILNDIQNATGQAVMATEQGGKAVALGLNLSSQTSESIQSLSQGINNVAQAAGQISLSSQQQLVGVNQVNIAMSNIKQASNQQVEHMQQVEGGVQGLNQVGKGLRVQVEEYKL